MVHEPGTAQDTQSTHAGGVKGTDIPDGILVIDKPRGPSSHQVTAWVGELLGSKVGHSGTLDPQVSGVLVVMIGKAVRLAPLLLREDKEYVCLMRLHGEVSRERLETVLQEFTGRIYQRPPRKSAVARNLRIRSIHRIELLDLQGCLALLRVACDAGTYIRSLCHHIGLACGAGAHMQELRRTRSGCFREETAHTLWQLKDIVEGGKDHGLYLKSFILSPDTALHSIPRITVRDTAVDAVCHGAALAGVGIMSFSAPFRKGDTVALMTGKGEVICLGEALVPSAVLHPGSPGLVIAPRTVFLAPGTYKPCWRRHAPPPVPRRTQRR